MDVKLLEDLIARDLVPLSRPDGFGITKEEYATNIRCTIAQATYMLDNLVKEGILEKHNMTYAGKNGRVAVYHKPSEYPPHA